VTTAVFPLWQSRNLLVEWTLRVLRGRYEQSVLGWLWAVIQPATQAAILAVIFTKVVPVETSGSPYLLFVFAATAPWAFLAMSVTDMTASIVDNMNLVNKVHFAREVLPTATMLARLADLGITLLFVIALATWFGVPWVSPALLALPVVVAVQVLLIFGIGLASAALNVFVRDIRSMVQLGLQLLFYASPVLYPTGKVPASLRPYYHLNPMTGILDAYRAVLIDATWPTASFGVAVLVSMLAAALGYWLFSVLSHRFADVV
jgi:lipopolysaccharide transport system permease protein